MEILEQRIQKLNHELTDLASLEDGLKSQLKTINIQIAQKMGAINELKKILEELNTTSS